MTTAEHSIGFTGFGDGAIGFLRGLEADNSKDYFEAHRAVYERDVMEPLRALVVDLGEGLQQLVPTVAAEPKVGRSLFRINRDLRFSADKTPYRTHLDVIFWDGGSPRSSPSFILRVAPDEVVTGVGVAGVRGARLQRYRAAVAEEPSGAALGAAVDAARRAFPDATFSDVVRARVPKGFPVDHPRADLLRRDGFHVSVRSAVPDVLATGGFVDWCLERYRALAPLERWLVEHVGDD